MNTIVTELDYCKLSIHTELPPEAISAKKEEAAKRFRGMKIPGFRANHAPDFAIQLHFKHDIARTAKDLLVQEAFESAVLENGIKPFGRPSVTSVSLEGERFTADFTTHTMPQFELGQYKGFEIPKPADVMTAEEFGQRILQDLRTRMGETTQYTDEDFVQQGDSIILDYQASLDGKEIPELHAEGEVVWVGKTPIEGFDTNLLGMNPGEERTFDLALPGDSPNQTLAGRTVSFKVKLLTGSKTTPAAVDDALARRVGLEDVNQLTAQVTSTAAARIKDTQDAALINQVSRRLVTAHAFKVPYWISTAEAQIKSRTQKRDWDKMTDAEKEQLVTQAEESIRLSMVLEKIREKEPDAQLTDEEAFSVAKSNIEKNSQDARATFDQIMQSGQLPLLMNHIRDEYTLAHIVKHCTVVE